MVIKEVPLSKEPVPYNVTKQSFAALNHWGPIEMFPAHEQTQTGSSKFFCETRTDRFSLSHDGSVYDIFLCNETKAPSIQKKLLQILHFDLFAS